MFISIVKVAKAFSEIFELDYDEVLAKVQSTNSVQTIVKKVEETKSMVVKEGKQTEAKINQAVDKAEAEASKTLKKPSLKVESTN